MADVEVGGGPDGLIPPVRAANPAQLPACFRTGGAMGECGSEAGRAKGTGPDRPIGAGHQMHKTHGGLVFGGVCERKLRSKRRTWGLTNRKLAAQGLAACVPEAGTRTAQSRR